MNAKKMTAVLAALCMTASLAACAGSSSEPESSATQPVQADTTAPAETEAAPETTAAPEPVLEIDTNAITFEDGQFYTAHAMEGGDPDEAPVELTVEEYNGDKKLKVHVLRDDPKEKFAVPKIVFNLPELLGLENVGNIGHISVDFTCVALEPWKNDDGTESLVVGNFLGALAGNLASEKGYDEEDNLIQNVWATHIEFSQQDWNNPEHTWRIETDVPPMLPANGYASNDEGTTLVVMRWGQENAVDFYMDNITFYDKNGNSMPIVFSAAAEDGSEDTDDAEPEAVSEPAETTAAAETTKAEETTKAAEETTGTAE